MHFKEFRGRKTLIRKALKRDMEEYKTQICTHHNSMMNYDKISEDSKYEYLAIERENGKMIGLIKIDMSVKEMFIEISIPNYAFKMRYGTEALRQFIKCCKERELCEVLRLKKENTIIERYRCEKPEELEEDNDVFILKIA